jgi:hypothetical protein
MEHCTRCREAWFKMNLRDDICARYHRIDRQRKPEEPFLFNSDNSLGPGSLANLPALTQVEEMLIARVYVFIEIRQIRGAQYKYKSHIVNSLRDIGKVYNSLPLLSRDLEIVLFRPLNTFQNPRLNRQFIKDFRVRQNVVCRWLEFLR